MRSLTFSRAASIQLLERAILSSGNGPFDGTSEMGLLAQQLAARMSFCYRQAQFFRRFVVRAASAIDAMTGPISATLARSRSRSSSESVEHRKSLRERAANTTLCPL